MMIFLAIEITDQTADISEKGGNAGMASHMFGHSGHADVERDMIIEQGWINTQVDILRHPIGSMVGNYENAPETGLADQPERFAHRSLPCICHQPE